MKKIAITGGIGSGKSTACKIIKELGYPVYSCDEIYKEVVLSKEYIEKIDQTFVGVVKNGSIDKKELSNIVFSDEEQLKKLNTIAHPIVMQRLLSNMEKENSAICFAEVPLLFEGNFQDLFDGCLIIRRKKTDRIKAVKERDGLSEREILSRMQNQVNHCRIKSTPKIVKITNNDTEQILREKIKNYIENL